MVERPMLGVRAVPAANWSATGRWRSVLSPSAPLRRWDRRGTAWPDADSCSVSSWNRCRRNTPASARVRNSAWLPWRGGAGLGTGPRRRRPRPARRPRAAQLRPGRVRLCTRRLPRRWRQTRRHGVGPAPRPSAFSRGFGALPRAPHGHGRSARIGRAACVLRVDFLRVHARPHRLRCAAWCSWGCCRRWRSTTWKRSATRCTSSTAASAKRSVPRRAALTRGRR